MVILFLLLWFGAIGSWAGWSLGTRLFYAHSPDVFDPSSLRIWSLVPAIIFAVVGVLLGFATLIYLEARLG
jgi:hypothetical protein